MNFKLICKDNVFYADSRQVAELVDKRHSDLCRDIAKYADIVSTNAELRSLDFFIESGYVDRKGETRKCYLLTKKGCDMVANKMTGEKGVLFTATYIDKFYEMEHRLKSGTAKPLDESKTKRLAIMERNAKVREAALWAKLAEGSSGTYQQVCKAYAANTLAEKDVVTLPKAEAKTYTATEIGNMLNVSAHKIGRLANVHKLKTAEYGSWYHDKAKHSGKEVETFRYNAKAIDRFRQILHCIDTDSETAELVGDIVIIAE